MLKVIPHLYEHPSNNSEATPSNPSEDRRWLLWQLLDSAFPSGGFAHSGGLEAARYAGEVSDEETLLQYLEASLVQTGRGKLPFVDAAHRAPEEFARIDQFCEAFTTNTVANRASRVQGQSLLASADRIFEEPAIGDLRERVRREKSPCHYVPVFGSVCRMLGVSLAEARRMFLFITIRDLIAAAVRLNLMGTFQGQAVLHQLSAWARRVDEDTAHLTLEDVAQTAPLLDILQATHDRQYSKLFQS
jgi:urease accessory protein